MNELLTFAGLTLTGTAIVASAVWAVASIRGSTRALGRSIDSLRQAVDRLDRILADLGQRMDHLNTRVSRIEGRHMIDEAPGRAAAG